MAKVLTFYDKPHGDGLTNFCQMNAELEEHTNPNYFDHYLLKPIFGMIEILLGTDLFKSVLQSPIDCLQISLVEDLGMEKRGKFYDKTGVVRDMVQNHVLQLACLMIRSIINDLRKEDIHTANQFILENTELTDFIIGQYLAGEHNGQPIVSYCQEEDIDAQSITPTYFAGKLSMCGIDVYTRTGKRLAKKIAELIINLSSGSKIIFRLAPNPTTIIRLNDEITFKHDLTNLAPEVPYAEIIRDLMIGHTNRTVSPSWINLSWKVVDPALKSTNLCYYEAGSWGPVEATIMLQKDNQTWWIPGRE